MITYAILMTLVVGMFIGSTGTFYALYLMEKHDTKALAMDRHPAGGRIDPNQILTPSL